MSGGLAREVTGSFLIFDTILTGDLEVRGDVLPADVHKIRIGWHLNNEDMRDFRFF